jgi:hypothetical protein
MKRLIVPKSTAMPRRTTTIPKYIGFLVTRYIPLVTRCVDSSNGFIGVPTLAKVAAAQTRTPSPIAISSAPRSVIGGCKSIPIGARKWRPAIVAAVTRK